MPTNYRIAFWNLENLFDVEDSPRRTDKLQRAIGGDLKGWDQALLDKKISQLASVIRKMNSWKGPDLLGVCEVENEHVLNLLIQALASLGRNYKVAHEDTKDQRGIDVAFIYDEGLFKLKDKFSHFVVRRTATRDLFQANFTTKSGRLFVVIGNHWPSRSGGRLESDGYRFIAGETLAYFHERIREVHGNDTPVLAMGDFNDEPFDRSLDVYALSTRSEDKVIRANNPLFLNLMWEIAGKGTGSHYFDNYPNVLDQFLVNKNLLKEGMPFSVDKDSVKIYTPSEMVSGGTYPAPIRFGGMGKPVDQNGYSDHYPILVSITEKD